MKQRTRFFVAITFIALPLLGDEVSRPAVTLSGLSQFQFRGPSAQTPGTFLLRRAEVRISAVVTPRVTGYVVIDPAKQGSVLQDLVVSWEVLPKTFLDTGQFKLPLGYEGDLVSSAALQNIERALVFQARDPLGGGSGDVRDVGIRVRRSLGPLDVQAGAFNGLGERQNGTATSSGRAGVARIVFNSPQRKGLLLGVSAARAGSGATLRRTVGSAFVVYKSGRVTLQTELVTSRNLYRERGYYTHAGWQLTRRLEGTVRYDTFDFNRLSSADTVVRDLIAGINYYLKGNSAKIQANLIQRNGGAALGAANGYWSSAAGFAGSGTQLRVSFQMGF